jgi:restriction system protein
MGYETQLTPPQNDGGRDILACKRGPGKLEHLRVECKQHNKPVGVKTIRAVLGVVSDEKVNKGVLVATTRFTKGTKDFAGKNPRLELIPVNDLIPLLNEHLGASWPRKIERLVVESQRHNTPIKNQQ